MVHSDSFCTNSHMLQQCELHSGLGRLLWQLRSEKEAEWTDRPVSVLDRLTAFDLLSTSDVPTKGRLLSSHEATQSRGGDEWGAIWSKRDPIFNWETLKQDRFYLKTLKMHHKVLKMKIFNSVFLSEASSSYLFLLFPLSLYLLLSFLCLCPSIRKHSALLLSEIDI